MLTEVLEFHIPRVQHKRHRLCFAASFTWSTNQETKRCFGSSRSCCVQT